MANQAPPHIPSESRPSATDATRRFRRAPIARRHLTPLDPRRTAASTVDPVRLTTPTRRLAGRQPPKVATAPAPLVTAASRLIRLTTVGMASVTPASRLAAVGPTLPPKRRAPIVRRRLSPPTGKADKTAATRQLADPRNTAPAAVRPYVRQVLTGQARQGAKLPVHDRTSVARVHRTTPDRSVTALVARPHAVTFTPEPAMDLDALGRDLWRRFERQLRIEQERRGRR
ncbi:hypothetical protein EDD30_1073 [Couchioplanes caeruleus]|uniref:Uncharacterized protein n=3 Tax=Couchioplanes caeruleus TaxID=56438 RepID=A0A1K0FNB4_9ACTN|nr:hypothetical protein BG844_11120 [Couchioplanes caeruleus subsp. caeruleus]ROP28326.1 hypothetical protein EDD30_1073 [Couchioplanes caeruleus]